MAGTLVEYHMCVLICGRDADVCVCFSIFMFFIFKRHSYIDTPFLLYPGLLYFFWFYRFDKLLNRTIGASTKRHGFLSTRDFCSISCASSNSTFSWSSLASFKASLNVWGIFHFVCWISYEPAFLKLGKTSEVTQRLKILIFWILSSIRGHFVTHPYPSLIAFEIVINNVSSQIFLFSIIPLNAS